MSLNERNGKFVVITITIFVILLSLIGLFVYENQLGNYSNDGNYVNEVIQINFIINFGNGTSLYYNNTSVSNNASMLEITKNAVNGQMDSQYYAEFDAYFINEIFGVEGNNEFIWTAWSFGCCKWELLDIGSNLYYPKEGQTIAWYYQEATKFGKGNPN